jgi:hypothetical protein
MALDGNLIVRPYNEVVDDVLVAMLGGVVNEPLIYSTRDDAYPLVQEARDVRGITGVAFDEQAGKAIHYTFLPNVDWAFAPPKTVRWLERGTKPVEGSTFYADYFRQDAPDSPLTDINVGSVTRTLTEAISRELAVLYSQVNLAYQSGFIDLAQGRALDFVVALLGVQRKTADYALGEVSLFRALAAEGNITIPQGVKLITPDGVVFETTSERTIQRGQMRVDVPARAADAFKGPAGRVDAHTVTSLIIPIAGIERVTNFDPMALGAADETDDELRRRAKRVLRGLGQCTVDALQLAALEARATGVDIRDPQFPIGDDNAGKRTTPGKVVMVVEVEPERFDNVTSAVDARRAAGVHVAFIARYVYIRLRIKVALKRPLNQAGQDQVKRDVIEALRGFLNALGSGKAVKGAELLDAIKPLQDVDRAKSQIRELLVWRAELEAQDQLGQRVPARDLIVGPDGAPATDANIETGQFQINIAGSYWPVLEMDAADIALEIPGAGG